MSREELLEKGYSDAQVSELLDMFHKNNSNLTKQNEKLASDLANANNKIAGLSEMEQEYNSLKQEQLSEADKLALQRKEAEENLANSKKILNEAKARVVLAEIGGVSDSVLKSLVTEDETTTMQNANDLLNQFKMFRDETINKTKEEIASLSPKPTPSNTNLTASSINWEQFEKMSEEDQVKFQTEHPDEFAKL